MFYNFEEEKKVLYEYGLGDLPSLSEEELLSVGAVNFMCCLNDEEDSNEFVKWLLKLKEKTSKLENITKLQSYESIFTPEVVQTLAECFPYVKTFRMKKKRCWTLNRIWQSILTIKTVNDNRCGYGKQKIS